MRHQTELNTSYSTAGSSICLWSEGNSKYRMAEEEMFVRVTFRVTDPIHNYIKRSFIVISSFETILKYSSQETFYKIQSSLDLHLSSLHRSLFNVPFSPDP
jgi:hypothetical protein